MDLYERYGGICAYSAHWIPPDCGAMTVDHFVPKSAAPHLAYEWDNYRLCTLEMNRNKGTKEGILDPFVIQPGWFKMDFPSLQVTAESSLPSATARAVTKTIKSFKLNDETCVKARYAYLQDYMGNHRDFYSLSHDAPFLAFELQRQGMADREAIKKVMSYDEPYVASALS